MQASQLRAVTVRRHPTLFATASLGTAHQNNRAQPDVLYEPSMLGRTDQSNFHECTGAQSPVVQAHGTMQRDAKPPRIRQPTQLSIGVAIRRPRLGSRRAQCRASDPRPAMRGRRRGCTVRNAHRTGAPTPTHGLLLSPGRGRLTPSCGAGRAAGPTTPCWTCGQCRSDQSPGLANGCVPPTGASTAARRVSRAIRDALHIRGQHDDVSP